MADIKQLLEVRKKIKRRKPFFIRQDAEKFKRIGFTWRKPKGLHSKMRLKYRGFRKSISVGYKSPLAVKHFDKSGLLPKLVASVQELLKINNKSEGIIVSGKVGLRKRLEIIKEAQKLSIKILNIKDPAQFLKVCEDNLKERKEEKQKSDQEKKKKLKIREEKAKEKQKEKKEQEKTSTVEKPEDLAEKIQKEEEEKKKEMDKLLTKKTA